jgi:hypothetical protein
MILTKEHDGIVGGHYAEKTTTQKILHPGLWWSILHEYAKEQFQNRNIYQRVGRPLQRDEIPLNPQVTLQEFDKWIVDFVRLINQPYRRTRSMYIITMTNYMKRCAET